MLRLLDALSRNPVERAAKLPLDHRIADGHRSAEAGIHRRATLLGFAGLALAPAGTLTGTILKRRSSMAAERQLLRWLSDRRGNAAGLAALGEAYFTLRPDERDPIWLKQALLCDGWGEDCCLAVAKSAAADRTAGDVVVLEGWILARSEARLVSLAYLLTTR